MAYIGEMQYLTIGNNTYSLPTGGGGDGTVTSVGVANATNGGLSVSGSPITTAGTITIGHSNVLSSAQTTQAVYPIKIDKNGHISAYGDAVTIPSAGTTASAVGTSSSGGSATTWSKSDHIHSISSSTIISALGYTPYNSTNPDGYISSYTDEKLKWTASTSSNTYYPLQSTSTATTSTANTLNGISFYQYYNTAGGYRRLDLGNSTAYKSTGGAYGTIRLYGAAATYYGDLVPGVLGTTSGDGHISANRTWTLPDKTGTIALTSDIPTVSYPVTSVNNKTGAVSLTASDVSAATSDHTHGNITNGGDITATAPTIANGDQIIINDNSASKITNGPTFDGSTTTKALTQKGTWETFSKFSGSYNDLTNKPTLTDTKNTAGSTNSTSQLYLIGATEQSANPQTYSNDGLYINNEGTLITQSFASYGSVGFSPGTSEYTFDNSYFNLSTKVYTQEDVSDSVRGAFIGGDYTGLTLGSYKGNNYSDITTYLRVSSEDETIEITNLSTPSNNTDAATKKYVDDSVGAITVTDEKLAVSEANLNASYSVLLGYGESAQTRQLDGGLWYQRTSGTPATANLYIGNGGHSSGNLILEDGTSHYTKVTTNTQTANRTITLPDKTGTVALTSDIPEDKNMMWTATTSTNTYYPLQSTSSSTTSTANTLNGISFYQYYNTAGGYRRLDLGNSTAYKSTGGAYGTIRLYGAAATYYGDLVPGVLGTTSGDGHISANRTWTLPDKTGTIALTSDIPDVSSFITVDEKVKQSNNTTSNANLRILFSQSAIDTDQTSTVYKSTNLTYNPSTKTLSTDNLQTTQINGVTVGSSPKFTDTNTISAWYGTCSSNSTTETKIVSCSGFTLSTGALIAVHFSSGNQLGGAIKLNINSTGDKPIYYKGAAVSTSNMLYWQNDENILFSYDGTNYQYVSNSFVVNEIGSSTSVSILLSTDAGNKYKSSNLSFSSGASSNSPQLIIGDSSTSTGILTLGNNGKQISITPTTLSASRTITLPDKTGTVALTSDIPDVSGYSTTDEKLKVEELSNNTTYSLILSGGSSIAAKKNVDSDFQYVYMKNDTGTGSAKLTIGNSTASGTAGNKQGQLILYGSTAYAHTIVGAPTSNRTITLPNDTGTLALTTDIVDENVKQVNTTGTDTYRILFSYNANNNTETVPVRKSKDLTFTTTTGNLQTIQLNGVTVGSSPKFTDTVTTVTSSGSGNVVTGMTASNGAITYTMGTVSTTAAQIIRW